MKVQPASKELRDETARMLKFLRSKKENLTRDKSQHELEHSYDIEFGLNLGILRWVLEEHKDYDNHEYEFVIETSEDYEGWTTTHLNSYRLGYITDLEYYAQVKERYTAVNGLTNYIHAVLEYHNELKLQGINVQYYEAQRMYQAAIRINKEYKQHND